MIERTKRRYWIALLALVTLLAAYAQRRDLYGLYLDYQGSTARVDSLGHDLEAARVERIALERRVDYLDSDPLEMEAAIRRNKSLVRPGEIVYRVELPGDREN